MAEINYLPICLIIALRLGLVSSISSSLLVISYNHLRGHCQRLSQIQHGGVG